MPIQVAAIPEALAGRDIRGQAPTGSGKTLAYVLPLLANLDAGSPSGGPRALVLVPTRELADQICGVVSSLLGSRKPEAVALYGGVGYGSQRQALRRGARIVVGCPGRIEDLVARGDLDLSRVGMVVIDEADRMVDMGFIRPVCRILDRTPANRQVLLFSATMSAEVDKISNQYQRQPVQHRVEVDPKAPIDVRHHFWRVSRADRVNLTAQIVAHHGQAFVFCRTKHGADRVARQLRDAGVAAAPIHGDRSQPERTRALANFGTGGTKVLVATDVVARGIHVDNVPCVVHFDPPGDADSYIHRSGRTGRAGAPGVVVSLVPDELEADVRALQRALGYPQGTSVPFDVSAADRDRFRAEPRRFEREARPSRSAGGDGPGRGGRKTSRLPGGPARARAIRGDGNPMVRADSSARAKTRGGQRAGSQAQRRARQKTGRNAVVGP